MNLVIVTLNIWGLPGWLAQYRNERVLEIGKALREIGADVICLQEVWVEKDYQVLKNLLKSQFKYAHYFYSGVIGSGLCIFSKWPIKDTMYHQWPLNGYIHMVHHGDWFGGKGVGLAVLDVNGYAVNIYTAHLHAQYHDNASDPYVVHRVEQAFDTGLFIKLTSTEASLSVLAGDLNAEPGGLCERLVRHTAELVDSYSAARADCRIGTNECERNSFASSSANKEGLRIDYILYRPGVTIKAKAVDYYFPLPPKVPSKQFSYSDHEAVAVKFEISPDIPHSPLGAEPEQFASDLREAIDICNSAMGQLDKTSWFYWSLALSLAVAILVTPFYVEFPLLHSTLYYIILVFSVIFMVCFILMATLWCKLEYNGILGVKERMLLLLSQIESGGDL